MKKILTSLIAVSLLATPAMAREHHNYEYREKSGGNGCGWLCGAIIGGVVIGALSSKRDEEREREYDNRYYPPDYRYDRRYCVREQIVEWRYGERYIYWQTTCN
jgi:hypothetical protein